jgi:hypothetical protein
MSSALSLTRLNPTLPGRLELPRQAGQLVRGLYGEELSGRIPLIANINTTPFRCIFLKRKGQKIVKEYLNILYYSKYII